MTRFFFSWCWSVGHQPPSDQESSLGTNNQRTMTMPVLPPGRVLLADVRARDSGDCHDRMSFFSGVSHLLCPMPDFRGCTRSFLPSNSPLPTRYHLFLKHSSSNSEHFLPLGHHSSRKWATTRWTVRQRPSTLSPPRPQQRPFSSSPVAVNPP